MFTFKLHSLLTLFLLVGDKEYDVCVLYTSSTAYKTSDYFVPTLQNKYSYKCCSYQLPDSIDQS